MDFVGILRTEKKQQHLTLDTWLLKLVVSENLVVQTWLLKPTKSQTLWDFSWHVFTSPAAGGLQMHGVAKRLETLRCHWWMVAHAACGLGGFFGVGTFCRFFLEAPKFFFKLKRLYWCSVVLVKISLGKVFGATKVTSNIIKLFVFSINVLNLLQLTLIQAGERPSRISVFRILRLDLENLGGSS